MKILVLNAGSSGQKSCLFEVDSTTRPDPQPAPLWQAQLDGTRLTVSTTTAGSLEEDISALSSSSAVSFATSSSPALSRLLQTLWGGSTQVIKGPQEIDVVGHRVVHGGREYSYPTRVTPNVKSAIRRLSVLAPTHNLAALDGIETIEKLVPDVPQLAVFDTAFHNTLPCEAAVYPGPYEWAERGIRRYGFHGISHQDCATRAARLLGRDLASLRLITCHLGNGCSLAAIREGRSIDTTMGFTPMDGIMMGTRSGSVDPGILLHLLRENGYSIEHLDRLLNKESGLKGVSGLSGDMRDIIAAKTLGSKRAQLAFDIYVHRLCAGIGSMLASLGGLDVLIFTGGVGEHSAELRSAVCQRLAFWGLLLDPVRNETASDDREISSASSPVRVLVIQAQEDWAIARECVQLQSGRPG